MKIVAHRGFPAMIPENTIPSFAAVLKHPQCGKLITGIEIDIRLSKDGRMVLYHDDCACFKGARTPIEKLSQAELQEAVEIRFGGVKVPVLDETFDCVAHRLELLVEMKDGAYDKKAFMNSLDASLRRYNPKGDVILHSFSPELMELAVERFEGKARGVRFGVLAGCAEDLKKFSPALLSKIETVHPYWESLVRQEKEFAAYGKPFNVWTVNRKHELALVKNIKNSAMVRAVMTDDLRLMETL